MPEIAVAARRICTLWGDPSPATVNEIVQDVFLKLCEDDRRILREMEDRGNDSFLKLIRVVTASVGTDHFRRIRAEKRGGQAEAVPLEARLEDEELLDFKATEAVEWPALMAQLDGMLRLYPETISERDINIFWLYYRQGMTAQAMSKMPGIGLSAKGVESALKRMVRQLRETILNGKPKSRITSGKTNKTEKGKGFSAAVTINSMKRQ
jgi:RNA polymerase sigma-70 factor (ECF subfamily)